MVVGVRLVRWNAAFGQQQLRRFSRRAARKGNVVGKRSGGSMSGARPPPRMAVGTWSWGDEPTWEYSPAEHDRGIEQAFFESLESGIDFFDTADVYGDKVKSESMLGGLISEAARGGREVRVATKFTPWAWRVPAASSLRSTLQQSLERLKLDSVELLQISSFAPTWLRTEWLADALADVQEAGLAKSVGVCNASVEEVELVHGVLAKRGIRLHSNQVEFSLLRRVPETSGLVDRCHSLGVYVFGYSPLGSGRLTGKYSASQPAFGGRRFGNQPYDVIDPLVGRLAKVAGEVGRGVPAVAINYVSAKGVIPVVGVRTGDNARENATATSGWSLTNKQIAFLEAGSVQGKCNLSWQHG